MFGRKKPTEKTVHVEFFDAETGGRFAEVDLLASQLPESFEASTTMHLGNEDWQVDRANPMTAAEFIASGRLRLVLRRVRQVTVDPKQILFSLPTICDALPGVAPGSTKLGVNVLEIHEDDWRQVELVAAASAGMSEAVDATMEGIRNVYATQREGNFFRSLHVRREVQAPLGDLDISLDELRDAMGPRTTWLDGVAFQGVAGLVAGGYACRMLASIELFGVADPAGRVHALCVASARVNNAGPADVRAIRAFAADRRLTLIDWCAARKVSPFEEEFETYFTPE